MDGRQLKSAQSRAVEEAALAQAVRHWAAESDAADRLTGRSNALLGLMVAVLGYGIWQVDSLQSVQSWALRWTMRALLGMALVLVLAALVVLLVPPRRRKSQSLPSTRLALGVSLPRTGVRWDEADVFRAARRKTEEANRMCVAHNAWIQARMNEAQALFLSAGLCAGVAVLCYLCFSP
jgi:DMSO reductase anchor subunit